MMSENFPVHVFDEVSSTIDVAWRLTAEGRLPVWGSVLAASQTAGRGRMGRTWQSPPGHVYAAMRLPTAPPFDGPGAALAVAVLLASALGDLGVTVHVKWPNDLVSEAGKVAGILLEAKRGALVAGVGLNLGTPPGGDWARDPLAPPAAALPLTLTPGELWRELARRAVFYYNKKFSPDGRGRLAPEAETMLLWKGRRVTVEGPSAEPAAPPHRPLEGLLAGLAPDGALRLTTAEGEYKIWSGLVRRADGRRI